MRASKTEARWRRLIAEQERSGQSVREFAAAKGLSAWSLYGWRSRLGVSAARKRGGRKGRRRNGDESATELVAVDVVVGGSAGVVAQDPLLEVEVGDVRVRVPRGFDADELGRLVSVLRASC